METLRLRTRDKHVALVSTQEHGAISNDERKRLCNSAFIGDALEDVYMSREYIKNIASDGRATMWLGFHLLSDLYDKLTTDEKTSGRV